MYYQTNGSIYVYLGFIHLLIITIIKHITKIYFTISVLSKTFFVGAVFALCFLQNTSFKFIHRMSTDIAHCDSYCL